MPLKQYKPTSPGRRFGTVADIGGGFAGAFGADFAELHGGNFHVQVYAVEQRPGDAPEIFLDFVR